MVKKITDRLLNLPECRLDSNHGVNTSRSFVSGKTSGKSMEPTCTNLNTAVLHQKKKQKKLCTLFLGIGFMKRQPLFDVEASNENLNIYLGKKCLAVELIMFVVCFQ